MFEVDARFVSKRFMSQSNLFWLPSYNQTDVRTGYEFGNFSIEGFVENALNNKDPRSGSSTVDYGYFDLNRSTCRAARWSRWRRDRPGESGSERNSEQSSMTS